MNTILKKRAEYTDARGTIETLVDNLDFKSVLRITSTVGSVRANHKHKVDYHVCVLTKGKMKYYERPENSKEKPSVVEINPGDIFYTPPTAEHAMQFLEDSEFWCFSKLSRAQENYEADTVRLVDDLTKL